MDEERLNLAEAINFLDFLGIEYENETNKFKLLSQITSRYLEKIPFNNLTVMSSPTKRPQSMEQIINCIKKGHGGICYDINVFFQLLLKALGYDAHLLLTSLFFPTTDTESHSAILVKNLMKQGDNWIIDIGHFATFSPRNLDFEKESPVFQEIYADYKYVKRGDTYIRLQRSTEILPIPHIEEGWGHAYYFKLEPVERAHIEKRLDKIIYKGKQKWNWFHTLPLVMAFPEGKTVLFRRDHFLREGEDRKAYRENINGDIVRAVLKEFPTIPEKQLKIAIAKSQSLKSKL